jgi:dTDP-4-dehydrorhamnose reductase
MPDRRILLFGANGQLGHEIPGALAELGEVIALDRAAADLARPESLRSVVRRYSPQIVVNAAAYTAVDKAEDETDLANAVNAAAPGVLAEEAQRLGACIVHYSTDYVFDGQKTSPYDENDMPNPLSAYGRSKLAGERAVASACRRHLIFRASWLFGVHGQNFLKTILRAASERDTLRVVADQHGVPTSVATVARVTRDVLRSEISASGDESGWGLYHLAASGETTWHGYAQRIVDQARIMGVALKTTAARVVPITSAEYPTPAQRPANSRLDTTKLRSRFKVSLPHWQHDVDQVIRQLSAQ